MATSRTVRRERVINQEPVVMSPSQSAPRIVEEEVVETDAPTVAPVTDREEYEFALGKVNQAFWALIVIIELFIVLRFFFLFMGANNVGFVAAIYDFTSIFVAPFRGVFDSPQYGESYFDTASLLAMVMWLVIGFVITTIIRLFSTRTTNV